MWHVLLLLVLDDNNGGKVVRKNKSCFLSLLCLAVEGKTVFPQIT